MFDVDVLCNDCEPFFNYLRLFGHTELLSLIVKVLPLVVVPPNDMGAYFVIEHSFDAIFGILNRLADDNDRSICSEFNSRARYATLLEFKFDMLFEAYLL